MTDPKPGDALTKRDRLTAKIRHLEAQASCSGRYDMVEPTKEVHRRLAEAKEELAAMDAPTGEGERMALDPDIESVLDMAANDASPGEGVIVGSAERKIRALSPCSCWVEALNLWRHKRDWKLGCTCGDHSIKEQCDCPFCSLILAPTDTPESGESAAREYDQACEHSLEAIRKAIEYGLHASPLDIDPHDDEEWLVDAAMNGIRKSLEAGESAEQVAEALTVAVRTFETRAVAEEEHRMTETAAAYRRRASALRDLLAQPAAPPREGERTRVHATRWSMLTTILAEIARGGRHKRAEDEPPPEPPEWAQWGLRWMTWIEGRRPFSEAQAVASPSEGELWKTDRGFTRDEILKALADAAWNSRMDGGCHSRTSEILTLWHKRLTATPPEPEGQGEPEWTPPSDLDCEWEHLYECLRVLDCVVHAERDGNRVTTHVAPWTSENRRAVYQVEEAFTGWFYFKCTPPDFFPVEGDGPPPYTHPQPATEESDE